MKAADESVAPSDTRASDRIPPPFISTASTRPGAAACAGRLDCAVTIFTDEAVTDATAFDWSQINLQQVQKLRSVMVDRNAAAGTVNHMLSGVRSTVRIAWELGLVDDKTRIAVEDEPNEKPQQRRRAGRYVKRGEVRRLFAAPGTDPIGARDVAILALLYGAGLRRTGPTAGTQVVPISGAVITLDALHTTRNTTVSIVEQHGADYLLTVKGKRSEAVALQLADYDQMSGAITVRHDERQVYATNGGKEAIDAWIASRGDWPGALLCPVAKGGRIQPRDMSAQAVMVRVHAIAEQAGVDLVTPNDLRLTYLTELERQRLDARTKGRPEGVPAPVMLPVPYQAP